MPFAEVEEELKKKKLKHSVEKKKYSEKKKQKVKRKWNDAH